MQMLRSSGRRRSPAEGGHQPKEVTSRRSQASQVRSVLLTRDCHRGYGLVEEDLTWLPPRLHRASNEGEGFSASRLRHNKQAVPDLCPDSW
ncbi:hypothetical protein Cob_v004227 [Colletotrichum orbiculare MAFF 240422]|uniref:Uncharacterized protein n=1 Tax=Colletotrichum orbiculare (strain 104-T / ATCC 96160 / CBS 514.97 / LARS 414 / MAFF 240422) TaxID=1213857 RepID=A0A484FY90_COLOR|nr:hypothetical protein Cob_v004227 [Colletotrichum orbiculare MAFF 240422]